MDNVYLLKAKMHNEVVPSSGLKRGEVSAFVTDTLLQIADGVRIARERKVNVPQALSDSISFTLLIEGNQIVFRVPLDLNEK